MFVQNKEHIMAIVLWKEVDDNCAEKMYGGATVIQSFNWNGFANDAWHPEGNGEPGFQLGDMLIYLANSGFKISGAFIKDPSKSSVNINTRIEWYYDYSGNSTSRTLYDVSFKTSLNTSTGQQTLL
jgi:hypothetical protein